MDQKKMQHIVFYKATKAVCPVCGGLLRTLKSDEIILQCIDCHVILKAIGHGHAESELLCEKVEFK